MHPSLNTKYTVDSDGWLTGVRRVVSPNFNQRPADEAPSLLVIHNISLPPGEFGGGFIESFFCNQLDIALHPYFKEIQDMQVSSHLLISREGEVTQFVSLLDRAWHAGKSCFNERENCNDFSIGIELEGTDKLPYTAIQYRMLSEITQTIMAAFPGITEDEIVGHSDIAPDRKTDPGEAFDWPYYRELVSK